MLSDPELRRRRRRRLWVPLAALLGLLAGAAALAPGAHAPEPAAAPPARTPPPERPLVAPPPAGQPANGPLSERIPWRSSRASGAPFAGRLYKGVQLPDQGRDWFTWDPIRKQSPSRSWRRWGTDRLVRTLVRVLRAYRAAHPAAPRVGIGDLSRPHGGSFDERFGGIGHASHQNGLDVDVYYPRKDGLERRAHAPRLVDRALAQDLVDRFAAAGAQFVFVGPRVGLRGRRGVVQKLVHHDDHLHVRVRRAR